MGHEDVGELCYMICLHLLYREGEEFHHPVGEVYGVSRAELLIGLNEARSGTVINGSVLVFLLQSL